MKNKILLVDDTEEILNNLRDYLLMEGFEVTTANNGKDALKKMANNLPDLVVTDLLMDEMTGFELVRAIRKNNTNRSIKILVFSARPKEEDEEIAQLDIEQFILKPANPDTIVNKIRQLLSSF